MSERIHALVGRLRALLMDPFVVEKLLGDPEYSRKLLLVAGLFGLEVP